MNHSSDTRAPSARTLALGAAIRRHRGDLSQTELALKVNHSQSAISQWETGIIQVSCEQVVEIERSLRLRPGTILVEAGYVDESILGIDATRRYAIWKLQEAVTLLIASGVESEVDDPRAEVASLDTCQL